MKRSACIGLVAWVLAGCATAPPDRPTAAPDTQVSAPPVTSAAPATITFIRDSGFIGSAVYLHISIDGRQVASLMPGESTTMPVDPGSYLLSVIPTNTFGGHKPTAMEVDWKERQKATYRLGWDGNLRVTLTRDVPLR